MIYNINNINNKLNPLWAQNIDKIDYDLFGGKITIYVSDEMKKQSIIMFNGVSSFLWIRSSDGVAINFEESIYLELTSILVGTANVNFKEDKWLKYYSLKPNILIEILDSAMAIQANEIILNGEEFSLID